MHPQPQYPSSDINSFTPSTPASARSAPSNSSRDDKKPKAPTLDQDPKFPDGAEHRHSKYNGKCPLCGQPNALTKPKWQSKTERLFIRCTKSPCKYWRYTDYYTDPPSSTPPTATSTGSLRAGVSNLCVAQPCSTGNKRNRNTACANQVCLQDCPQHGRSDCSAHRHAKRNQSSGSQAGRPPPVLFNGPSLSSMPSIPSSSTALLSSLWTPASHTPSPLDAALPPSSPNPANPRSLLEITTSTIQPSVDNPLPRPTASPLQEGPIFPQVHRYARELPQDCAAVITAQQSTKAQQMLYEAQFRSSIKEGISITVVFWRARLGVAPYLFERVIHVGREYSFSEDVDLCKEVGFNPNRCFDSCAPDKICLLCFQVLSGSRG